jgi:G3E family GTPase
VNFAQTRQENSLVTSQIADADLSVVSKVELAGVEKVQQLTTLLKRMTPDVQVLVFDEHLSPDIFVTPLRLGQPKQSAATHDHHQHQEYQTYYYTTPASLDVVATLAFLQKLPNSIWRVKGLVHNQTPAGSLKIKVQKVGAHVTSETAEWTADEEPQTVILFIGQKFDQQMIEKTLNGFKQSV